MRSPGETASAWDNETFDARHPATRRLWVVPDAGTFDMAYSYVSSTGEVESVSGTNNYVIDTDYHAAGMVTDMTHLSSGVANQMLRRNIY